jgi:hypothetical protein
MTSDIGTMALPQDVDQAGAYAQSFGLLSDRTQYAGYTTVPMAPNGVELKSENPRDARPLLLEKMQIGMKAISTTSGGAGTAGYAMTPISVDPEIIDRSRKNTPLTEIFPRVTNQGAYAVFNFIVSKGGGFTAAEDAALAETNTTYDQDAVAIKSLYAVGRVTGQALQAQPSFILAGFQPAGGAVGGFGSQSASNAVQREVLVKSREWKELEENLLINGDASSDATQFSGFIKLIDTTNKVDLNTAALELQHVNRAYRNAYDDGGRPNLGVCSSSVYEDLQNLIQAKVGYLQSEENVFWGFSTLVYRGMAGKVPVIPSMFMSNVSGSKALYLLDLTVWEVRVLMDMTFERLGKNNDSDKFMLKGYECLICRAPAFNGFVGEIA